MYHNKIYGLHFSVYKYKRFLFDVTEKDYATGIVQDDPTCPMKSYNFDL